jgi:uncharacterized protein YjdB
MIVPRTRRFPPLLLALVLALPLLASCGEGGPTTNAPPAVTGVEFVGGSRSVPIGATLALAVTVGSRGGASEAVSWSSEAPAIATVDARGVVAGVAVGQAVITATSVFDPHHSASVTVTVQAAPGGPGAPVPPGSPGVPATISIVAGDGQTGTVGAALPVRPSVRVLDADDTPLAGVSVTFAVTVGGGLVTPEAPVVTDANGVATLTSWNLGIRPGTNRLSASVGDVGAEFTATGTTGSPSAAASLVTADPTTLPADGSATSQLTVQLKDAYGNDTDTVGANVTFATPSEGSIGSVGDAGSGTYTATYTAGTSAGSVTITPRLDGTDFTNTATITLTAGPQVQGVVIEGGDLTLDVGDTLTLTAIVTQTGGAPTTVTWSSSDPEVATMGATSGNLIAVGAGTATITATSTYDPSRSGTITVAVGPPPEPAAVLGVVIVGGDVDLRIGDTLVLTAVVDTTGGASQAVTWSSSDPDVAAIGASSGNLTAIGTGTATITAASAFDANQTDTITVGVRRRPGPPVRSPPG